MSMRTILGKVCVLLVATLLAACGPKDTRPHLMIWHTKDAREGALFRELLAAYNAKHPETVVQALKKDPDELRNLYVIAAVAGQGPDLAFVPADSVGVFVTTKTVLALDDLFPVETGFLDRFAPEGIVRWRDRPWLVGDQIGNHLVLVCNRDLVPKPPETLDDLIRIAKELTTRDAQGNITRYGLTWNYQAPFFFVPFLTGFGGWVMDENEQPALDNPQTVAALQFVLDLRKKHGVIPPEGDYNTASTLFKEGRAAMILNGSWSWADYGVPDKSYVALIPLNAANGKRCVSTVSPNGYVVNSNLPQEKRAAARSLLSFLTSAEVQLRMARELKTLPSDIAARQAPEVREDPTLRVSAEQAAESIPLPVLPQMRQIWDGMIGPYQLIMNGDLSAAEGAKQMQREAEKLYRDSAL